MRFSKLDCNDSLELAILHQHLLYIRATTCVVIGVCDSSKLYCAHIEKN